MALFELSEDKIEAVEPTTFNEVQLHERTDLQRLFRDQVEVVAQDVLVIAEEFGDWEESRRRIDLLGVDRDANLVVVELKRTPDGGHMELQALRYAAMVSTLTAANTIEIFGNYLRQRGKDGDPETLLLEFLEWENLDEDRFAQDVRIVLVSADFSRELTSSVIWLNEKDLDIRCVRIQSYAYDGHVLIDVQQVVPLPEAADYQIQLRDKKRQERQTRKSNADFTRFDVTIDGTVHRSQWKRNAILLVIKRLIESGQTPDAIAEMLAPVKGGRVWFAIAGETHDRDEFHQLATADAETNGRRYEDRRWHTSKGDLFIHEGRTYAFSNQWGQSWAAAMKILQDQSPGVEFTWEPTTTKK